LCPFKAYLLLYVPSGVPFRFVYSTNGVYLYYISKQINHLEDQVNGFYNNNGE
jgi:hypothetical protein